MYYFIEVLEGILYYTRHTYDITILARIPIGIEYLVALWSRQVFSYYYISNI